MNAMKNDHGPELVFRRYDPTEASELAETVEHVYRESYREAIATGRVFNTVDSFMNRYENYVRRPSFELVVAYQESEPIGQTWGWPLSDGSGWWAGLEFEPERDFATENGQRTFALSEIMVSHDWTGLGIAHRLHDTLLTGRSEQRATLLVRPDNPARERYLHWGWAPVSRLRPNWAGAPLFDVMILDLTRFRQREDSGN